MARIVLSLLVCVFLAIQVSSKKPNNELPTNWDTDEPCTRLNEECDLQHDMGLEGQCCGNDGVKRWCAGGSRIICLEEVGEGEDCTDASGGVCADGLKCKAWDYPKNMTCIRV